MKHHCCDSKRCLRNKKIERIVFSTFVSRNQVLHNVISKHWSTKTLYVNQESFVNVFLIKPPACRDMRKPFRNSITRFRELSQEYKFLFSQELMNMRIFLYEKF